MAPASSTRLMCYCDDCQAFAHFLDRPDLLDDHGGSDVVQVAPAALQIVAGAEHIRCVRLSAKGIHRWFTACCRSPIGNTLGPGVPFIGVHAACFDAAPGASSSSARQDVLGPIRGYAYGKFAIAGVPAEVARTGRFAMVARAAGNLLAWKLTGKASPHPFFTGPARSPISEPRVLTAGERDALRR
jgi:hypothetical protein